MIDDPSTTLHIHIEGHSLPVWRYGDPKNPILVFLHGLPKPWSSYIGDLPVRHLMDSYCIYAFDFPGFGKSAHVTADLLACLHAIEKQLIKKRSYTLFGISFGGLVSLRYASTYPDKINGIIIAGSPLYMNFFGYAKPLILLPRVIKGLLRFSKTRDKIPGKKHPAAYVPLSRSIPYITFIKRQNLSKIHAPILLLYSRKDRVGPVSTAKRALSILPNASLVTIDDKSHGWLLHRIDENAFLPAIKAFLSDLHNR